MTIDEIKKRVAHIEEIAGDDEHTHIAEDRLRTDFIHYCTEIEHDTNLADKARLVLSTDKINFARWCA